MRGVVESIDRPVRGKRRARAECAQSSSSFQSHHRGGERDGEGTETKRRQTTRAHTHWLAALSLSGDRLDRMRGRRPEACLVVVCGKPSSGKTRTVDKLRERLGRDDVGADVVVVDEASVNAGKRDEAYENATKEKMTRGGLRSACDRSLHRSGPCVILDSLNAIKGFRYELWCVARAAASRYAVVYVETSDENVKAWNEERRARGEDSYDDAILEDLCFRFEHPIASNRWDSPLFTFRPATDTPGHEEDILDAVCAHVRGDASSTKPSARTLTPNKATQNAPLSETNMRYEMDRATQEVVDAIMEAQRNAGGSCSAYSFGPDMPPLRCSRVLTLAELRRRKRDFLQLASKSLNKPTREGVKKLFIECLQEASEG